MRFLVNKGFYTQSSKLYPGEEFEVVCCPRLGGQVEHEIQIFQPHKKPVLFKDRALEKDIIACCTQISTQPSNGYPAYPPPSAAQVISPVYEAHCPFKGFRHSVSLGSELRHACPTTSVGSPCGRHGWHEMEITPPGRPTYVDEVSDKDLACYCRVVQPAMAAVARAINNAFLIPPPPPQNTLSKEEATDAVRYLIGIDKARSCECGAEKCGFPGHSSWCPKA